MQETGKIWMNGELVDWADATVHVGVHGLHYGTGVFEGIRAYETPKGPAVFRLADHLQRLHDSAKLLYMELPYTVEELRAATHELVRTNGLPAVYIRPIAFFGYGSLGVHTRGNPVETVIMSWPWGAYLGEDALAKGIGEDLVLDARGAERDPARGEGDRDLPELDARDHRGAARRVRRGDPAHRPGLRRGRAGGEHLRGQERAHPHAAALDLDPPGVTRDSVIQIAQDLGYVVEEADIIRTELYLADEVFMTGTAAEVTLVRAVDDVELGVGDVTLEIQRAYLEVVNGRSEQWSYWLDVGRDGPRSV